MKRWIKNNPGKVLIAAVCLWPTAPIFTVVGLRRMAEAVNETQWVGGIFHALDPLNPFALFISGVTMYVFLFLLYHHSPDQDNARQVKHLRGGA